VVGHRLGQHGLAASWRPKEKYTTRRINA